MDCLENAVMGINGQFPGPTIRARARDTIVARDGTSMGPWPPSSMLKNPSSIPTVVSITFAGTYFYHGYYGMQSSREQEVDLSFKPFQWVGEPQTPLMNGRGQYNCSIAAQVSNTSSGPCNLTGNEQCAAQILNVQPNKTYRLRVASTTALASGAELESHVRVGPYISTN
ncbi:unnamed protein product [Ilex paraguariensis]|uniref:Uncharacterized protein n=1 Tax=Ilex paraguariensis TaxID=185542 RepID=A0ABC8T9B2_9AQUA